MDEGCTDAAIVMINAESIKQTIPTSERNPNITRQVMNELVKNITTSLFFFVDGKRISSIS